MSRELRQEIIVVSLGEIRERWVSLAGGIADVGTGWETRA